MMKKGIWPLLLLFIICAKLYAQTGVKYSSDVQQFIDSFQKARQFPGMTVSFIVDGTQTTLATGWSDVEANKPLGPGDRMLSGSTGKTFFATIAMQLVGEGKLNLDAKVSDYLGKKSWFTRLPNHEAITVRMLMNHTTGIEEYYDLGNFMDQLRNNPSKTWHHEELISFVLDQFNYADTNYLLLGLIMEEITGVNLYELIRKQILAPLKLNETSPSTSRKLKGLVPGYVGERSVFRIAGKTIEKGKFVINPQFEWAGGGFVSTSKDLAYWAKQYYNGNVSPKVDTAVMRKGVRANTGRDHLYGLGVQIRPSSIGKGYGHGGWFPGYLTEMEYFPEKDIAIAIQFNTDDFNKLGKHPRTVLLEILQLIARAKEEK
jgi:D-alanyl-D-alanine carboxypeptidase